MFHINCGLTMYQKNQLVSFTISKVETRSNSPQSQFAGRLPLHLMRREREKEPAVVMLFSAGRIASYIFTMTPCTEIYCLVEIRRIVRIQHSNRQWTIRYSRKTGEHILNHWRESLRWISLSSMRRRAPEMALLLHEKLKSKLKD